MLVLTLLSMIACGVTGGGDPIPQDEVDPEQSITGRSLYLPSGERTCAVVTTWHTTTDVQQWHVVQETSFDVEGDRNVMFLPMTDGGEADCMVGLASLDGIWRATVEDACTSPCGDGTAEINELIGRQDGDALDLRISMLSDTCTADIRVVCDLASINSATDWNGAWTCAAEQYDVSAAGAATQTSTVNLATKSDDTRIDINGCFVPTTAEAVAVQSDPNVCNSLLGIDSAEITGAAATVVNERLTAHVQYAADSTGTWSFWCIPQADE